MAHRAILGIIEDIKMNESHKSYSWPCNLIVMDEGEYNEETVNKENLM
jgi:hypothetical protein